MNIACRKKIKKILLSKSINYRMNKKEINECKSFCKDNFSGYSDTLWHSAYYGINGIWSLHYIPEHFFYNKLEDCLNPESARLPYFDKNNFDQLFPYIKKPKTVLRKIDGEFYDINYRSCLVEDVLDSNDIHEMIVKPSLSGRGGRGIVKIDSTEIKDYLQNETDSNFIVQALIKQHKELSKFNKSCVNTLKISTLKISAKAGICSVRLRIGKGNSIVDNPGAGGLFIGVNRDGSLKEHFLCKTDGYSQNETPDDWKVHSDDFRIPSWDILTKAVTDLHDSIPGLRLLSWDMAIDENGEPILIEVNAGNQDINNHQFANGPLFGDMTEDVLDWYKKQKKNKNQSFIKVIRV